MSEALSSLRAPIDPGRGGVLLANMLASWLDHDPSWTASAEARDESEDSRTSPQQACLHLSAPVDAGPSSPPSGEHGAPVRLAREGAGTGLERIPDSHPRPGFGKDGNGDDAAGGLQDFSGRCLDGPGGRCLPWKSRAWRARISIGSGCWSSARSRPLSSSTRMVVTTRRTSTTVSS